MPFVLDASVTAVWAMRDEAHPLADLAFHRLDEEKALVPGIWWYEIRNILRMNERRQRISIADTNQFLANLDDYPIVIDPLWSEVDLLDLSRRFQLTVYDAAYLDLALRERLPLATLDSALRTAAETAGVSLLA
jgi:predicted nucleic acid-binding protein